MTRLMSLTIRLLDEKLLMKIIFLFAFHNFVVKADASAGAETNIREISIELKFLSNIYDAVPYYFMTRQRIRSNHNVQLPFAFTQCVIKFFS